MARGSRNRNRYSERDALTSLTPQVARVVPRSHPLSLIQDFRTFDFEPATRPALSVFGTPARYSVGGASRSSKARSRSLLPSMVSFADAQRVVVCVRRKTRRQVLFAKRRTGRGARSRKRRNFFSGIRC